MAREAIFIGYRRDDTVDVAGRVYDALSARFGRGRIFKDVDNLRPGADFGEHIRGLLPRCRVALILIGPNWVSAVDERGRRRLDDPNDWVRIEVELALATPHLDVVPVLVNGARMPSAEELPPSLHPLLRRHAAIIRRDPDFHDDVGRLATALRASVKTGILDLASLGGDRTKAASAREGARPPTALWAAIAALVVVGAGFAAWRVLPPLFERGTVVEAQADTTNPPTPATTEAPPPVVTEAPAATTTPPAANTTTSPPTPSTTTTWRAGQEFDDCSGAGWCPRMVVIPAGSFLMGSPESEPDRGSDEGPQRRVSIRQFAVGKFEVSFDQWDMFARVGLGSRYFPNDQGWGRGSRPVINVSWEDAQEYVRWLSRETRQSYRLLTEAEWEYTARAGTNTAYSTGASISLAQANFNGGPGRTQPMGSYAANAFGLHDMHGNVWEWVQDCYAQSYSGLPTNGSTYETNCSLRVSRGGSWRSGPQVLRAAYRDWYSPASRSNNIGFRVARTLN